MPNFSSTPRQPIHPDAIHPFKDAAPTRGIPLRRSDPRAEAALDAWMERANKK